MCTGNDLPELLRLLNDARASWEGIATQLGLSQGDVDAIAKKFDDPKDCLRESLKLWLRRVDPVPTREQLARALQSPPVGREDIAQKVVPGLPKLPKSPPKLSEVDPVQLGRRPLQSPPVGREDIAHVQQVVPGLPKLPIKSQHCSKFWLVYLCSILLALVTLVLIMGCVVYFYKDSSPGRSLSLPVLQQKLFGREEEMEVIFGNFSVSKVKLFTLYGQAGFGKSEIALHIGHQMLKWGYDVHYIRVEEFKNISSLEKKLMEISDTSSTSMELEKWARGLIKKTLLILDNVDGQHWVSDTSRLQLNELFLNPLLRNTIHLQVLITSQQDKMIIHSASQSHRLYSLSTDNCICLMINHYRNTSDTGDLRDICDLVGNVPFASKILAKTLSSGTSAKYIIQTLESNNKLEFIANRAGKDMLLCAIKLAFQFVKKECQISTFLLIKFQYPFTLDDASLYITADMMSEYFNYTDFDLYKCLLELTAKSFLEQYSRYKDDKYLEDVKYHFHELSVDYLKISNSERTEILMVYWKKHLSSRVVNWFFSADDSDYDALSQLINNDDYSFEASIAVMIHFSFSKKSLISASRVLVSHCEVQDYNSTILHTIVIRGYANLLEYVICRQGFPTEWNCMDVISLCLPIIDSVHADHHFSDFIVRKYLEIGSSHKTWDSIWKHSLRVYAHSNLVSFTAIRMGLFTHLYPINMAIHSLHMALEDTSSRYYFMIYMSLYTIYSTQGNLTGMEESLANIHKLDFQQINITCYTYSADYEDPHVTTAILFLQQVNETNLADKLRSKLFVGTAKMGCCDIKLNINLMNSLFWRDFNVPFDNL